MTTVKVANLHKQGQDMVIVPLDRSFGQRPSNEQDDVISEIQAASIYARLRGTVVPVWDAGGGGMAFIAPPQWHPFFKSISLRWVWANVNRDLTW